MDDLDDLYALHADPRVWEHFPSGRHGDRDRTAAMLATFVQSWTDVGLGYWTARVQASGDFAGIGGCMLRSGIAWNLYYRFRPEVHGNGYATELAVAAREAAVIVRPDLPVVAYLLEHNDASRRTAERAGLGLVWRGRDAGNPDPDAVRLVYADRDLPPTLLAELTAHP